MFNLAIFAKANTKPIYVHLVDHQTILRFLRDAENQGFTFSDGAKPTEKHISDFFVLHSDLSMNYAGAVGRIAYQCKADNIIRINYIEKTAE